MIDKYIDVWKNVLKGLLEWDDKKIDSFINSHLPIDNMFYHESPLYWVSIALIDETIYNNFNKIEKLNYKKKCLEFLQKYDNTGFSTEIDWSLYRIEYFMITLQFLVDDYDNKKDISIYIPTLKEFILKDHEPCYNHLVFDITKLVDNYSLNNDIKTYIEGIDNFLEIIKDIENSTDCDCGGCFG